MNQHFTKHQVQIRYKKPNSMLKKLENKLKTVMNAAFPSMISQE